MFFPAGQSLDPKDLKALRLDAIFNPLLRHLGKFVICKRNQVDGQIARCYPTRERSRLRSLMTSTDKKINTYIFIFWGANDNKLKVRTKSILHVFLIFN